jgi:hypothetical protein
MCIQSQGHTTLHLSSPEGYAAVPSGGQNWRDTPLAADTDITVLPIIREDKIECKWETL